MANRLPLPHFTPLRFSTALRQRKCKLYHRPEALRASPPPRGPKTPKCSVRLHELPLRRLAHGAPLARNTTPSPLPPGEPLLPSQDPFRHSCGKRSGSPGWTPQPRASLPGHGPGQEEEASQSSRQGHTGRGSKGVRKVD